jgi:hypothetical protein
MTSSDTPSTSTVRALVRTLLEQHDFADRDELLAQVDGVEYEDGPLTMMRLRVSSEFPASHGVCSPVPNRPVVIDHDGQVIGKLLLWLDDSGYIDCLEYARVTDEIPTRLPDPNRGGLRETHEWRVGHVPTHLRGESDQADSWLSWSANVFAMSLASVRKWMSALTWLGVQDSSSWVRFWLARA